jgi:hypothetical protein
METMTIQQAVEKVNDSASSIFTKEDVINILKNIKEEDKKETPDLENMLIDLREKIIKSVKRLDSDEIVDFDSIELSLNYSREIVIDSVSLDYSIITDEIEVVFSEILSEIEEKQEQKEEQQ